MKYNLKYEAGLPNSLKGKSMADASKAIENMFKDRLSKIDNDTKEVLLNRIKDFDRMQLQATSRTSNEASLRTPIQFGTGGDDDELTDEEFNALDDSTLDDILGDYTNENSTSFGKFLNKYDTSILGGLGIAASILGPMISNRLAAKSLQKPESLQAYTVNENQYQPNLVNRQQIERNIANQYSTSKAALQRSSSGNFGQLAANLQALHAGTSNALGNAMLNANIADSNELARIQELKSKIQLYNAQQRAQTDDLNQQNLSNYYNQIAAYKQATGANIGAIGQSLFNLMQSDKVSKELFKTAKISQ